MEVKGVRQYFFQVVLGRNEKESESEYINRTRKCLDSFVIKNCGRNSHRPLNDNDEKLKDENNWCNMYFPEAKIPSNTISYCDVKYSVRTEWGEMSGISIWAHSTEDKKFWVDFLREKWQDFEYSF